MALPDSIQKQLDEAEALEALMAADEPDTPDPQEPAEPEAPVAEREPEPKVEETPTVDWEQKYKTLDGKFNSQVPRLQQELSNTKSQIQALTDELAKLKQKPAEPEGKAKSREVEDDEELVGADIVKAAERAAARAIAKVQSKLDALESENLSLKQQLGQVSEHQSSFAEQDFFTRLTTEVPDWRQLESTDHGQEFLTSRIPGTHQTWDQALKGAAGGYDLTGTVEIFNEMVRRHPELRAAKPKAAKSELEKQIAPNKNKSAAPVETKKTWTQREANDAWEAINKRTVKGKEAEDLEAELEAAMMEGRIR